MRYFFNYYSAKKLAEQRGLREREYGDTGYMLGGNPLSYCEWNKSGSRDDDAEIVCYYGWQKHWHQDRNCWGLIPEKRASAKRIKEIIWGE